MSLRERVRKVRLRRETVEVPEWAPDDWASPDGGPYTVTVREMTGPELEQQQRDQVEIDAEGKGRIEPKVNNARLVCWCVIDPTTGAREFADDDLDVLRATGGKVLERIGAVVLRLSGYGDAKKKPSVTTPPSCESTSSPGTSASPTPTG